MPYKSARMCNYPGCPNLVYDKGASRCPEHQAEMVREYTARRRAEGKAADYGPEWAKISKRFLQVNHICVRCGHPSEIAHHIIERTQGGSDEWGNLLPLCNVCHTYIHKKATVKTP